jgi:hypothetical protein
MAGQQFVLHAAMKEPNYLHGPKWPHETALGAQKAASSSAKGRSKVQREEATGQRSGKHLYLGVMAFVVSALCPGAQRLKNAMLFCQ